MTKRPRPSRVKRAARPAPAKLAPPTMTHRHYRRERLYQHLSQLHATPLLWLSAPAGYGKTTLVAGYLQTSAQSHIWYQCDAGDADIASFFYYLAMARANMKPRCRMPLPEFLPEHYAAIPTFTRHFFRALFASFEGSTTLVLDNLQDVPRKPLSCRCCPCWPNKSPPTCRSSSSAAQIPARP